MEILEDYMSMMNLPPALAYGGEMNTSDTALLMAAVAIRQSSTVKFYMIHR